MRPDLAERNRTPAQRAAGSTRMRRLWQDPAWRAKMAARMSQTWRERRADFIAPLLGNDRRRLASVIGQCYYCAGNATEYDHRVPRARGGTNAPENLVPCCIRCNAAKGRLTDDEFRALVSV